MTDILIACIIYKGNGNLPAILRALMRQDAQDLFSFSLLILDSTDNGLAKQAVDDLERVPFADIRYEHLAIKNLGILNLTKSEIEEDGKVVWLKPQDALKILEKTLEQNNISDEIKYFNKFVIGRDIAILKEYMKKL